MLSPNGIEVADPMCLHCVDVGQGGVRVTWYVAPTEAAQAAATVQAAAAQLGVSTDVSAQDVQGQDWNRVWKQFYAPLVVGDRVRVEPAWMQGPEIEGMIRIAIDPGMAFGTGTHETTQLCMQQVVAWVDAAQAQGVVLANQAILDLGTGSAILAILAVKMGFGRAIGTEIDAAALGSARTNLALNAVQDCVDLRHGGDPALAGPQRYPLVVANILATVLVPLRDAIVARVQPAGTVVLSGILTRQAQSVAAHYAQRGLQVVRIASAGDWAAVVLRQPN